MSFANVQGQIAKREGVSPQRAAAILASGTRRAGAAARKRNPKLNRVRGYKRGGRVRAASSVREKSRDGCMTTRRGGVMDKDMDGD